MEQNRILQNLSELTKRAVAQYWQTRAAQRQKQEQRGKADQGLRSAVTGGAQMDGVSTFSRRKPLTYPVSSDPPKNGISSLLRGEY